MSDNQKVDNGVLPVFTTESIEQGDGSQRQVIEIGSLDASVSIGGGTEYTEGDIDASVTGGATMWKDSSDTLQVAGEDNPLPVTGTAPALNIEKALDFASFDLNAAAFSETTAIAASYILDHIELSFSTSESRAVTVTTASGTVIYEATSTYQNGKPLSFDLSYASGEEITVDVTQTSGACTLTCIVRVKKANAVIGAAPSLGPSSELIGIPYDFYVEIKKGNVPGHSIISKFGAIKNLTTALTPITTAGVYPTPAALTSLEFLSDNANDTAAGTGATKVTFEGLGPGWTLLSEEIATNGLTPVALANQYYRIFRKYVSESGTYASAAGASHAGILTLREASAGPTWATIELEGGFGLGQSQIAAYTIPEGKRAAIISKHFTTETNKPVTFIFFTRPNADDVTTPYTGVMRTKEMERGIDTTYAVKPVAPTGFEQGPCDVGFMGNTAASTADVSLDFEILLIDDGY